MWTYGSIPNADHLDCGAGLPPFIESLRFAWPKYLGENKEYRYKLWRNHFIRLRLLDYNDSGKI